MDGWVGLAALVIGGAGGYAAGRGWGPLNRPRRGDGGDLAAAGADPAGSPAQDWAHAERGRPWESAGAAQDAEVRGTAAVDRCERERAKLIGACADLADRLRDRQPALYAVLTRELGSIGVTMQSPDSEPFDAASHNAVGTEPATDQAQDLRVAETTRLGYLDHGAQVRVPDVIVYRWQES